MFQARTINMKRRILLIMCLLCSLLTWAADKAENDSAFFALLANGEVVAPWHRTLAIDESRMEPTRENAIYLQRGDFYQVKSVRNDVYLQQNADGGYEVVNSYRYPLETIVNLLLGYIDENDHYMFVSHHQYGGKIKRVLIPMRRLYDLLCPTMDVYCSVTGIDPVDAKGVVVFHEKNGNYIHMLDITTSPTEIAQPKTTIFAELYTNIPQSNVKTLFGERIKNE